MKICNPVQTYAKSVHELVFGVWYQLRNMEYHTQVQPDFQRKKYCSCNNHLSMSLPLPKPPPSNQKCAQPHRPLSNPTEPSYIKSLWEALHEAVGHQGVALL
jgi:hypothetical protein